MGAFISGFLMDKIGRRRAVQLSFAPYLVGWLMIATADDVINICIGRAITGIAVGMGATCYVYVAEITRPDDRSLMLMFGPSFVSLGILIIYSLGYIVHWKISAMFSFACCVVGCLLLQFIPETPVWLSKKGQDKKANEAMIWFRGVNTESNISHDSHVKHSSDSFFEKFMKNHSWKPLLIMVIFFILQVGSGIYEVVYYAVDFIEKSGSSVKPHVVSISLALIRLITGIIGSWAIQQYDRRIMVIISASGMGFSMFLAGLYEFYFEELDIKERPYDTTPQIFLILNIAFSTLGVHQLPWSLTGELFPLCIRGVMNGIIPSFGYIAIFSMVKIYPLLLDSFNMFGCMWLFTGFSVLTVFFGKYILPETRGKSLQEIESMFVKEQFEMSNSQTVSKAKAEN
ncbi:facilitated trehalose transporter Tret1-like [Lycorma delicatula]|uniref:facilitated trehalose transporter Tret1-like n=1 Tax=Lycorma delicatula TaxID=130591 RepID=UPI003F5134DB